MRRGGDGVKITNEVRKFMIWEFGNGSGPQDAADYLYNQLCGDWFGQGDITDSKLFKELLVAFQWWDNRFDSDATEHFLKALKENGVEVTA
tara:strand:- start:266 stop:538 length:273 start_codon:yes stop_codon:yes gene_type:complete